MNHPRLPRLVSSRFVPGWLLPAVALLVACAACTDPKPTKGPPFQPGGAGGATGNGGATGGAAGAGGSMDGSSHWVGTWTGAPQLTETGNLPPTPLSNLTLFTK